MEKRYGNKIIIIIIIIIIPPPLSPFPPASVSPSLVCLSFRTVSACSVSLPPFLPPPSPPLSLSLFLSSLSVKWLSLSVCLPLSLPYPQRLSLFAQYSIFPVSLPPFHLSASLSLSPSTSSLSSSLSLPLSLSLSLSLTLSISSPLSLSPLPSPSLCHFLSPSDLFPQCLCLRLSA